MVAVMVVMTMVVVVSMAVMLVVVVTISSGGNGGGGDDGDDGGGGDDDCGGQPASRLDQKGPQTTRTLVHARPQPPGGKTTTSTCKGELSTDGYSYSRT